MKRILSITGMVLSLIMLVCAFAACGRTDNHDGSTEGVLFSENPDGTCSVVDYIGTATDVTIGSTYKGKKVTAIGEWAFIDCANIKSVVIPDSVTSIEWWAFSECTSLKSITIPDSVTSIGMKAFNNTAWYNDQPDGLVYAGKNVYQYKGTMPANTSITIADGTKSIADEAFSDCTGLTSITIPNSVASVNEDAFSRCTGITAITVANGNAKYHSNGNCLIETAGKNLVLGCKTSVIPTDGSVEKIGRSAFRNCPGITEITIPDSVKSISTFAFLDCADLSSVTFGSGVTKIGDSAFSGCAHLTQIIVPDSVISIGGCAFDDCTSLSQITIPDNVIIGSNAFDNTAWYNSQPDGLVYANKIAYQYKGTMPENTSIVLSDDTTSIAERAFYECENLASLTISANVTSIGDYSLSGCTGLTEIKVVNGNTKYSSSGNCLIDSTNKTLLLGCKNSVIPSDGSVTSIGEAAFSGCIGLTSITIPAGVTSIMSYAFSDCEALTSVSIGSGMKSIGSSAFYCCSGLTAVTIPSGVTYVGEVAFANCPKLATITVAAGNTKYHSAGNCLIETASKTLIAGCKSSVIPSDGSVTSIGTGAFDWCSSLTEITIPASVTSISTEAFYQCTGLKNIIFEDKSGWYVTTEELLFQNRTGGTAIDVNSSTANVTEFTEESEKCYYKLGK